MRHINKERIKSIAIASLLITSLIQVGILWGYQSQGTPTNFLKGIFGWQDEGISDDSAREKLFTPDRLVISNGEGSHWLISRQNTLFKLITNEAGGYLESIAGGDIVRSKPTEDWGSISSKQGFLLEFKTPVSPDLLKWFTGITKVSGDTPVVLKMMIKPDSVDENMSEVYILGPNGELGSYSVNSAKRPQTMQEMLTVFEDGVGSYRNYTSMRDSNFDSAMPFAPDVLYIAKSPKLWPYYQLQSAVPARLTNENELADIMLGSEKDRYNKNVYDGFLQYSNTENIYKVYGDGYLSYKYLSDPNLSEKGGIGDALMKAYTFINRLDKLTNMKTDIYLAKIDVTPQGYYTFWFDYRFNDLPVFVDLKTKRTDDFSAKNAIKIDASSKRVLKCDWIMREFSQGAKQTYRDRFLDIMDYYAVSYSGMNITAITTGYYLDSEDLQKIDPSLVIQEGNKSVQTFRMPVGKGD